MSRAKELWVYLGQDIKGSCWWQDPEGRQLSYKKLKGRTAGLRYEIEVEREGGGTSVFTDSMRYIERADDLENYPEIIARELRWSQQRAADSLEKRQSRRGEIDDAIADIVVLASRVNDWSARQALARYVGSKILGA